MTTSPASSPSSSTLPALPWLTVERLAYGLLVLLAVAARPLMLGARPLSPAEAETALRAWQAADGLGPVLDAGTPLLFTLQTLLFWLIGGASDALVRVWPLLASLALPLLIFQLRDWLGRRTALLAATLLSFSPLVNAFARRGDGVIFVLAALVVALIGWQHLRTGEQKGWMWLAVGLGLLLIGGSAAPTALLALALVLALTSAFARPLPAPGPAPATALVAVLLVGGAAFLTHLDGLGLAALNWSEWLAAWTLSPRQWLWGLLRLLLDEPLILPLGLAALIAARRNPGPIRTLALAGFVAAVVAVLQGQYASGSRAVAALLFAPAAAEGLLRVGQNAWHQRDQMEALLYAVVLQILLILSIYALISYTYDADTQSLLLLAATAVMSVVLTVVFGYFVGRTAVLSFAAAVLTLTLLAFNLSTAWGIAYDANMPRFPAIAAADGRLGVRDLAAAVGDISERQRGERWALDIAFIPGTSADDLVLWYLRRAPVLTEVQSVGPETAPPLVVAPAGRELPLAENYAGRDFALIDAWSPADGTIQEQIEWALFRAAPWHLTTENIVLWADSATLSLE